MFQQGKSSVMYNSPQLRRSLRGTNNIPFSSSRPSKAKTTLGMSTRNPTANEAIVQLAYITNPY